MEKDFAYQVFLDSSYDEAIEQVTAALQEEGFGVLTRIDVKATLKEKLNEDIEPYAILGACNPPLAHKALSSDPLVGLILPCNVTVRQVEDGCEVSLINPESMLAMSVLAGNQAIQDVASDARERFERVARKLVI